jgi:TonB family protein
MSAKKQIHCFTFRRVCLPHKDTYYNLALAKNCMDDADGFCYYMLLASELGDTAAHRLYHKFCSAFVKSEYLEKLNSERKVVLYSQKEVFTLVEDPPQFPGGEEALLQYLGSNIYYPHAARERGIQGTVFVTFVVEPDGSLSNVKILRGIGGGCDEEVLRLVLNMPKWKPGTQKGVAVPVQFNLPIRFILQYPGSEETTMTPLEQGIRFMESGFCHKADSVFENMQNIELKRHELEQLYYHLALTKKCLNDSAGYCYYMNLSSKQKNKDARQLYAVHCNGFDPERYLEDKKIQQKISAQKTGSKVCEEVFPVADVQPVFPGDLPAMNQYIHSNLNYPQRAIKNNISGNVYLSFIITHEGKTDHVVVLKGIGYGCDEEAVRIIRSMPRWQPGKVNDKPVCVQYNLAVKFQRD